LYTKNFKKAFVLSEGFLVANHKCKTPMKKYLFLYTFLFTTTIILAQDAFFKSRNITRFAINAKDDTISFVVYHKGLASKKPLLLLIQGSGPLPLFYFDKIKKDTLSLFPLDFTKYLDSFRVVIVEKKAVPLFDDIDKDYFSSDNISLEYAKHDYLEHYVKRYQKVLKYLRKQKWVDNKKIYAVGHSTGYRIVASLVKRDKKLAKVVCMSANPFNRYAQFVTETKVQQFRGIINDSIAKRNLDSIYTDFDNLPYYDLSKQTKMVQYAIRNEISFNYSLTINDLLKIKIPLLITYGTADLGSLDNDLVPYLFRAANKENLTLFTYPGLEHNYLKLDKDHNIVEQHWKDVFYDVQKWLLLP
jgi:dienelactone hydrolase